MNFFDAKLVKDGEESYHAQVGGVDVALSAEIQKALAGHGEQDVILGIRPEHIRFAPAGTPGTVTGTVEVSEMMGSEYYLHVTSNGKDVVLRVPTGDLPAELRGGITYGTAMNFTFRSDSIHLFDPDSEKNLISL